MNMLSIPKALFLAQGGKCFHCQSFMDSQPFSDTNGNGWTREHIHPVSMGGGNSYNVILAHRWCNAKRGNRVLKKHKITSAVFFMLIAEEIRTNPALCQMYVKAA